MDYKSLIDFAEFRPERLAYPNSWVGHIPFAAWLTKTLKPSVFVELGTHSGNSYLAFCQAVEEDHLPARCYAIDTWKGDEQAGFYDESVFQDLSHYHDEKYAKFSSLLRMTFNDAVSYFQDGEIELIHFDGLHTFDAVKKDFETWLPKLAPHAVVLFHDTNVREREFGVYKLWGELCSQYPLNLEFTHSNGLGVLQIAPGEKTFDIEWLHHETHDQKIIVDYFTNLGLKVMDLYRCQELEASINDSHEKEDQIQSLSTQLIQKEDSLQKHLVELEKNERLIRTLQNNRIEEKNLVVAAQNELDRRNQSVIALKDVLKNREKSICVLEGNVVSKDQSILELESNIAIKNTSISVLEKDITRKDEHIAKLTSDLETKDKLIEEYIDQIVEIQVRNSFFYLLKTGIRFFFYPIKRIVKRPRDKSDINFIISSGLFDEKWYLAKYPDVAAAGINPAYHYLKKGGFEGRDPGPNFSSECYFKNYPDVQKDRINPLVHYLRFGKKEGRSIFYEQRKQIENNLSNSQIEENADLNIPKEMVFQHTFIKEEEKTIANIKDAEPENDSNLNYLQNSHETNQTENNEIFDRNWYLLNYPDIAQSTIDPYQHFLFAGKNEGRLGVPPKYTAKEGNLAYDFSKETVLVVSHDASRTGAPILCLNIMRTFRKKYNVVSVVLGVDDTMINYFYNASTYVVGPMPSLALSQNPVFLKYVVNDLTKLYKFKFAIVNSIESRKLLQPLSECSIPTLSLIHEFSSYTKPKGAFLDEALWSNSTIFSTSLTLKDAINDNPELRDQQFYIVPQGYCTIPSIEQDMIQIADEDKRIKDFLRPEEITPDTIIILGVGSVILRKGVDLFVDCAAKIIKSCQDIKFRFIWIGKGYDPEHDLQYSVYLKDQIERAGLNNQIFFLEETSRIETAYKNADILLLTSRLDPLPNVAIDAMIHKIPLLCFDRSTGIADILTSNGIGDVCVLPYLDTKRMAERVLELAHSKELRQKVGTDLSHIAIKMFNMSKYVSSLEKIGLDSIASVTQEKIDELEIVNSGLARMDYFLTPNSLETYTDAIQHYVRMWASNICKRKLFPGFHPDIFREQYKSDKNSDPLANYIRAGKPDGPWNCEVVSPKDDAKPLPLDTKIALHVHVYYPDLLPELLKRLNTNNIYPDLLISVPNESTRKETTNMLEADYLGKIVDIQIVPNRGRDIGPFLTVFGKTIADHYDLVGHLHTKKSAEVAYENMGKNWYLFLLENLLGGKSNMADIILGKMAIDPTIGMVFPDDPHILGWGKNRIFAEDLSKRLGIESLPETLLFPVGTMFWARVESLLPLFSLNLDWKDYPNEPLPYDGTMLHAIERLLPLIVSSRGFRSVLTNVPGVTR